jgi:hypothetical protein
MDPFVLLPLSLMQTHENESVRNLASKRLPHFRGHQKSQCRLQKGQLTTTPLLPRILPGNRRAFARA